MKTLLYNKVLYGVYMIGKCTAVYTIPLELEVKICSMPINNISFGTDLSCNFLNTIITFN